MEKPIEPAKPVELVNHRKQKRRIYLAISTLFLIFIVGTLSYHAIEKWSWVDSFYFVGITLTTIGYGDLYPVTDIGKIFTVFYAIIGVGLTLFILTAVAEDYFSRRMESAFKMPAPNLKNIIDSERFSRLLPNSKKNKAKKVRNDIIKSLREEYQFDKKEKS